MTEENTLEQQEQNTIQRFLSAQVQDSLDSIIENPLDSRKLVRHLLKDKNNIGKSQEITQRQVNISQSPNMFSQRQSMNIQQALLNDSYKENIQNYQQNFNIIKSQDFSNYQMKQKDLIESCLTFNGNNIDEDMNFLSNALQPDKIFDLPMALIKVQKAFQQSNQNAMKLKESLELVLQRENKLLEKYNKSKKDYAKQILCYEDQLKNAKQKQKEQLLAFGQNIQNLQEQIQERDRALQRLKEQLTKLYQGNQDLRGSLELRDDKMHGIEKENQDLQKILKRKQQDLEELKLQFEKLRAAEERSSKDIEKIEQKSKKDIYQMKSQLEEKNLLIDILQKDKNCAKQEKKISQDQEEKLMNQLRKLQVNFKEDIEKKYVDLLDFKKNKDLEKEEIVSKLKSKNSKIRELEKRNEYCESQKRQQQDELEQLKNEINNLNDLNREAIKKQRESYERKMKEMEEEVNKLSLGRYKVELDQKQFFLKATKKSDKQTRELKSVLSYFIQKLDLSKISPDYLIEDQYLTLSEINVGKDMQNLLEEFNKKIEYITQNQQQKIEIYNLKSEYEQLVNAYKNELMMRRNLHNKLQELKGNIRVLCRIRPLLQHEILKKQKLPIKILNQQSLITSNNLKDQKFRFDRVFQPCESQSEVFEEVQQLITSCLDGFNVCIMAYGQTGSGKTYTMIGTDENPGLYFTAVDEIFAKIKERKGLIDYEIGVSFVEIYNENLRDLLSKKGQQVGQQIKLLQNGVGEIISDQIVKQVKQKNQVLLCLKDACLNRTIGVTNYNEQSSRSHFIFTLYVVGKHKETKKIFKGKLNLVDLAGSERILKTHAEGERIKEAQNINQSLTTLGKVFLALLNKQSHIPYRDSKLTHYLKDSIGGESKTMLIVQASPNPSDFSETVSSLNFGQRISQIEKGIVRATIENPSNCLTPSNFNNKINKSIINTQLNLKLQKQDDEENCLEYNSNDNMFSNQYIVDSSVSDLE